MRFQLTFLLLLVTTLSFSQSDLFEKAEEQYVLGKYREALSLLNEKIEKAPESEDHLLRALLYEAMDLRTNAHADFVQAISYNRDYLEAYYHFSNFLTDSKDYQRAISALSVMLEKLDASETQGIFFRIDRLGEQAVLVSSLSGMQAEILMSRGLAFQGLGMFEKALADMNAAIFIQESPDKYVNRGNLLSSMRMDKKAIEDLKKAVSMDPKYGLAWYNLFILDTTTELPNFLKSHREFAPMLSARAVEAVENSDYHLAQKLYKEALKLDPKNDLLLINAGRLDLRNGFFRAALKKFSNSYQINSNRKESLYLMANAFFGLKQFESAIDYYQKYLRTSPASADIWYNTAMAYLELKKYDQACSCLERADDLGMTQSRTFIQKYCTNE